MVAALTGAPQAGGVDGVFDPPPRSLGIFLPPSRRLEWWNLAATHRLHHRFVTPDPRALADPQALSGDLISSYYVEDCMEGCMRDCIIRYFPLPPRRVAEPAGDAAEARRAGGGAVARHGGRRVPVVHGRRGARGPLLSAPARGG
jgi:hypothetical protein